MLAYERVNTTRLELVEPEFSDEEEDLDLEKENVSPSTSNNGASSVANDTDAAPRDSDADCGKENVSETVASENGTPSIVSNIDACPTEKDAESEKENVSDPVTSNNGTSSVDNDADAAPSTSAVHQSQERADVGTPEATRAREILNDWDATGDAARTPIIESQWNIDFTVGHLITENGEKFQIRSLTWVSKNEIKVQSECCDNPAILRVQASASHTLRMTDYGASEISASHLSTLFHEYIAYIPFQEVLYKSDIGVVKHTLSATGLGVLFILLGSLSVKDDVRLHDFPWRNPPK
eukprot:gene28806-35769_t